MSTLGQKKVEGNAKGKLLRIIKSREPKLRENTKKAMFIKGHKTSEHIVSCLKDLYALKKPDAVMYQRKNNILPFENETSIEFFSEKTDSSLFALCSHTKKRPNNLVMGRLFEHKVLDMIELGVSNYKGIVEFGSEANSGIGIKPCFVFNGSDFNVSEDLIKLRSLFLDFFRGNEMDGINLKGLEHVIVCTAVAEVVHFRRYGIALKRSGSRIPRVELSEIGPRMDLTLRRTHFAARDLMEVAMKVPQQLQPKKAKNIAKSTLGDTLATIHMGRQDLSTLTTKRMKALKRKRIHETGAAIEEEQRAKRQRVGEDE
eukprot:TRINITY_DN2634_c0_g1_i1.p1 TRINITY_DN2634_c0_g1~~TRINITY_DN2634_c0_g1_i1.p1  ORF type:complete len:337 (+),score=119.97 TRINITY_DN2634_c0_g1_i1:69-1013(+)